MGFGQTRGGPSPGVVDRGPSMESAPKGGGGWGDGGGEVLEVRKKKGRVLK